MSRHLAWFFSVVVMLAVSAPLQALNYEVGGCKTGSGYVNFTTISAAVAGVPAGSKIQICPGVYPEQVTITQPLTLQGIGSGNANRAVITINPNGGFAPNVTSLGLGPVYAQVLVQNVTPAGPVNMTGITVDGAGANPGCSTLTLAGIFYASDTSGTVNEVTVRNQVNGGCAWGIWVENGGSTNETITIENSSVHNQGNGGIGNGGIGNGGISAVSIVPPTLSATIRGNFLSNTGGDAALGVAGNDAILSETNGEISENVITSNPQFATSIFATCPSVVVSGNTVANNTSGFGIEMCSGTAESNKLSNVGYSIVANSDGATTIKSNTIKNTLCGISFVGGSSSGTISGNTLNDAFYGFANWGGPPIGGNSLYNVDNVMSTTSDCP